MKPLTVEIHGVSTLNRGAELMAIAISENIRKYFPGSRVAVSPWFGSFESRGRYNLHTIFEDAAAGSCFARWRVQAARTALGLLAPGSLPTFGIVRPEEVDIVLDASGFAFSDQWGPEPARRLWRKMTSPVYRAKPLIMLPQALGPFLDPAVSAACRCLFARADLICARDEKSFTFVGELGEWPSLRRYPDFTSDVEPLTGLLENERGSFAAIVPNSRMMDKTAQGPAYIQFLERVLSLTCDRGFQAVLVVHDEHQDRKIAELIRDNLGRDLPIVEHSDPRFLKAVLARAAFVVGSRFHALISALSCGVPCVGVGWSHKYEALFSEYGISGCLLEDFSSQASVERALQGVMDSDRRAELARTIAAAGSRHKQQTAKMWSEVVEAIQRRTDKQSVGIGEGVVAQS